MRRDDELGIELPFVRLGQPPTCYTVFRLYCVRGLTKIRIEYAGAAYHVMARGNQRRDIYTDERDGKLWVATLGEACEKTGWRIHACVIMNSYSHRHPPTSRQSAGAT